ncbi:IS3 family transposase, partial [Streptomyces sp. NPDC004787]|uniref:IS3 family transposase n=1 Tax=Streptomyces sp. NPDC004787 TaxID=3154291 RepID=UPI0033BC8FEB
GAYGAPRVHAALQRKGAGCGRRRVARLMRLAELAGRQRRRRHRTTIPDRHAATRLDLVLRDFRVQPGSGRHPLVRQYHLHRHRRGLALPGHRHRHHLPARRGLGHRPDRGLREGHRQSPDRPDRFSDGRPFSPWLQEAGDRDQDDPAHHTGPRQPDIVMGVDTDKDVHIAAVVTATDVFVESRIFRQPLRDIRTVTGWGRALGRLSQAGVECTGSYGAVLSRYLRGNGRRPFAGRGRIRQQRTDPPALDAGPPPFSRPPAGNELVTVAMPSPSKSPTLPLQPTRATPARDTPAKARTPTPPLNSPNPKPLTRQSIKIQLEC